MLAFIGAAGSVDRVPSRVELDCENMRRDLVTTMLFDTMPGYDMPEIPYYTPFVSFSSLCFQVFLLEEVIILNVCDFFACDVVSQIEDLRRF